MATKAIKSKVNPSKNELIHTQRFFNHFWQYRLCQFTSSNLPPVGADGGGSEAPKKSKLSELSATATSETPVFSDLQPHSIYKFRHEEKPSIVVAIPKTSTHARNLEACQKVSLMAGHTDPQIFHWFKQLGTIPPRSIASGPVDVLHGDLQEEVWSECFVRHPLIHDLARDRWEKDETKTEEEKQFIDERIKEEDVARMKRMSSADWRGKHFERERNPKPVEDIESPIYVMKPDSFVVARIRPDVQLFGDYCGNLHRVWEKSIPPIDPLARAAMRFIRVSNVNRGKLVSSLNVNYNTKMMNAFIYSIDKNGLWVMGTHENYSEKQGHKKEKWNEFRMEFGQNQELTTEAELEFWWKGLMRLGTPETGTVGESMSGMDPADMEFRHQ